LAFERLWKDVQVWKAGRSYFPPAQKEVPLEDRPLLESMVPIGRFSEELSDFADGTALIENPDMVISVDSVFVHLPGGVGEVRPDYAVLFRGVAMAPRSPGFSLVSLGANQQPLLIYNYFTINNLKKWSEDCGLCPTVVYGNAFSLAPKGTAPLHHPQYSVI